MANNDPFDDPVFQTETQPKSAWRSLVDNITHGLAVVGEGAVHALPDTVGFTGDIAADAYLLGKNKYNKETGSDAPPERLSIPGMGPISQRVNQSFSAAEARAQAPSPRNTIERGLNVTSRGIADMLPFGAEAPGVMTVSGAGQGIGGEAAHDLFPNSEWAPLVGSLVGGAAGGGLGAARGIKTGMTIRAGMSHPDYERLVNEAILPNEGGGSLEHPKVNPKSGATGPMQVTPETARDPGYGIRPWDGKSQADLARVGRQKFALLLGKYGDPEKALAAYDWGEGNLNKAIAAHGDLWYDHAPEETQKYVAKGMTRVYGGPLSHVPEGPDGLPTNGNVIPIDAERMAAITQDQGMLDALSKEPGNIPLSYGKSLEDISGLTEEEVQQRIKDRENLPPANREYLDQLTAAERQDMDASATKPAPLDSSHEKFTPNIETPVAANAGDNLADAVNVERAKVFASAKGMPEEGTPEYQVWKDNHTKLQAALEEARAKYTGGGGGKGPPKEPPVPPSEPPAGGGDGVPPDTEELLGRLNKAIRKAGPVRAEANKMLTEERSRRIAAAQGVGKTGVGGEQGLYQELHQLGGEMPKPDFESIRGKFTQEEIDHLHNMIRSNPDMGYYERLNARQGLNKLLSKVGGEVPTNSELRLLHEAFGSHIDAALQSKKGLMAKIGRGIDQGIGIVNSAKIIGDLSVLLKNNGLMMGTPEYWRSIRKLPGMMASEKGYKQVFQLLKSHPDYHLVKRMNLSLTNMGEILNEREELFRSNLLEKIGDKVLGRFNPIKITERGYTGTANYVRISAALRLIEQDRKYGVDVEDSRYLNKTGEFINTLTGRSSLGKIGDRAVPFLSKFLWTPRQYVSRAKFIVGYIGNPAFWLRASPAVRIQAANSAMALAAWTAGTLYVAHALGAKVYTNILSPMFGKYKVNKTVYDATMGFGTHVRTAAQFLAGKKQNVDSGNIQDLGQGSRLGVLERWVENHSNPFAQLMISEMRGKDLLHPKDPMGVPHSWTEKDHHNPLAMAMTPMAAEGTLDAADAYGWHNPQTYITGLGEMPGVQSHTEEQRPAKTSKAKVSADPFADPFKDAIFGGSKDPFKDEVFK